jgi:hypothetical protein
MESSRRPKRRRRFARLYRDIRVINASSGKDPNGNTASGHDGPGQHQRIRPPKKTAAQKYGRQTRRPKNYDMWLNIIYLSWVETLVNEVLRLVPSVLTATIMATDMPAAIKPYSIAVAPD